MKHNARNNQGWCKVYTLTLGSNRQSPNIFSANFVVQKDSSHNIVSVYGARQQGWVHSFTKVHRALIVGD